MRIDKILRNLIVTIWAKCPYERIEMRNEKFAHYKNHVENLIEEKIQKSKR